MPPPEIGLTVLNTIACIEKETESICYLMERNWKLSLNNRVENSPKYFHMTLVRPLITVYQCIRQMYFKLSNEVTWSLCKIRFWVIGKFMEPLWNFSENFIIQDLKGKPFIEWNGKVPITYIYSFGTTRTQRKTNSKQTLNINCQIPCG